MCAKLLILESPGKVKKVTVVPCPDWKVVASVGHVRDLPVKEMGVAAPDFKPHYQPTERGADVLKRLGALAKQADVVYLATDPDREGEAIAWHVADALKLKDAKRVTYGEITESAVKAAVQSPRAIDMALVAAQEGRRVLIAFAGIWCPARSPAPWVRAFLPARPESGLTVGGRTGTGNHFLCECHALRGGTEL